MLNASAKIIYKKENKKNCLSAAAKQQTRNFSNSITTFTQKCYLFVSYLSSYILQFRSSTRSIIANFNNNNWLNQTAEPNSYYSLLIYKSIHKILNWFEKQSLNNSYRRRKRFVWCYICSIHKQFTSVNEKNTKIYVCNNHSCALKCW